MAIRIKEREQRKNNNTCTTRKMTKEEEKKYKKFTGSGIKVKKIYNLEGYLL